MAVLESLAPSGGSSSSPPLLIIAYARIENVFRLIDQALEQGVEQIYVAIDGPKSSQILCRQEEMVSQLLRKSDSLKIPINIWWRDRNLGVAVSVITALDWFFSKVNSGVILEDDLIIEDTFYYYASHYLNYFSKEAQILLISGNRFFPGAESSSGPCLVHYPQTWGWATWRDRWEQIRVNAYKIEDQSKGAFFDPVRNFWHYGTLRVLQGRIDTWDVPVANYMFKHKFYALIPPFNLVSNLGNDEYATHTTTQSALMNAPLQAFTAIPEIKTSELISNCNQANRLLELRVFSIRRIHALLPLYYFLDSFRNKSVKLESLSVRLQSVTIPD